MSDRTWMIYGVNGYTGELIAKEAKRCGLEPIVAGRREDAVRAVAEPLGFRTRVFSLDSVDTIAAALANVDALVLAAGPFSATSAPVVEACLRARTHYLDITGEIAVFEACHARDADARKAGIAVLPGVGFDVIPSDCLAASLKRALPDAISLELAFSGATVSKGTAKTAVEGLPDGGAVRIDGVITKVPAAARTMDVPFRSGIQHAMSIPWGDVSTAYHSTGIPNVVVFMAASRGMVRATRMSRPFVGLLRVPALRRMVKKAIERRVSGPSAEQLDNDVTQLWGRVTAPDGRTLEGTLVTPQAYKLTAMGAVRSVQRVLDGIQPGMLTPSMAFGADYITQFPGCDLRIDDRPAPSSSET
jgi:short subunit dehydrogenase-like uncharacterized protein